MSEAEISNCGKSVKVGVFQLASRPVFVPPTDVGHSQFLLIWCKGMLQENLWVLSQKGLSSSFYTSHGELD